MKRIIIIFSVFVFSLNCIGQNSPKYNWKLQSNISKIHLGYSDIGIWIEHLDTLMTKSPKIKIIPDKFSNEINARFVSYEKGTGALIKLDIKSGHELIGIDRKLLLVDEGTNASIGYILIPIGSDPPRIDGYKTKGQLLTGGNAEPFTIKGDNLDGITNLTSCDGKLTIDSIYSKDRSDNSLNVSLKANSLDYTRTSIIKCNYLAFDPQTLSLRDSETPQYSVNISLHQSSAIDLETDEKDFYVTDIAKDGKLTISVFKNKVQKNDVDFNNIRIVNNPLLTDGSGIKSGENNTGELQLFFKDIEALKGQKILINLETTDEKHIAYRIRLNLLSEPIISSIDNNKGDLKYIINDSLNQKIVIHGQNLTDVFIVTTGDTTLFKINVLEPTKDLKVFKLTIKSNTIEPGNYNFLVVRGSNTLQYLTLTLEEPRIPQHISSFFEIKQGETSYAPNPNGLDFNIDSKSGNIKFIFNPSKLKDGNGAQSVNIEIKYYNEDGSLISSYHPTNNGNSSIILRKGGNPYPLDLDVTDNTNDFIRPWGRAEVIISHSADFYKQELDLKEVYIQRINFIGKNKTTVTVSLTIPPALLIYGKDNENRIELLPINIGFGLNFSFRKDVKNKYAKRDFEIGTYFAGLNFAGNSVTDNSETKKTFIKKGDIAFMALGQINLRKNDNYVKIPILFGPGFTFPINGASCRGFFAFGIGVNF